MRFWDSSALLAVLLAEPEAPYLAALLRLDPEGLAWILTRVEVRSALCRCLRIGKLDPKEKERIWGDFGKLRASFAEFNQVERARDRAEELLERHRLRAADSLQLAAAMLASEDRGEPLALVTLDRHLAEAAALEGLGVLPPLTGDAEVREAPPRMVGRSITERRRSHARASARASL